MKECSRFCPAQDLCQTLSDREVLSKLTIVELEALGGRAHESAIANQLTMCAIQSLLEKDVDCLILEGGKNLNEELDSRLDEVRDYYTKPNPN